MSGDRSLFFMTLAIICMWLVLDEFLGKKRISGWISSVMGGGSGYNTMDTYMNTYSGTKYETMDGIVLDSGAKLGTESIFKKNPITGEMEEVYELVVPYPNHDITLNVPVDEVPQEYLNGGGSVTGGLQNLVNKANGTSSGGTTYLTIGSYSIVADGTGKYYVTKNGKKVTSSMSYTEAYKAYRDMI